MYHDFMLEMALFTFILIVIKSDVGVLTSPGYFMIFPPVVSLVMLVYFFVVWCHILLSHRLLSCILVFICEGWILLCGGGGGGGKLVSGLTVIPFFYDWVPYHYVFKIFLMVILQNILAVGTQLPLNGIMFTIRLLVPGLWYSKKKCGQWCSRRYQTCVRATTLQQKYKHQTKNNIEESKENFIKAPKC